MDDLITHATRFGIAGVAETAVERGYEVEEIAELLEVLDSIHERQLNDKKERTRLGLTGIAPNYRRTHLQRAEALVKELR